MLVDSGSAAQVLPGCSFSTSPCLPLSRRQARRRSALRPARSEAAPSPRVSPFWWEMPGKAPLPPAQQAALLGLRLLVWQWGVGLGWGYGYGYGYSYNLESSEWEVSLGWGLGWGWGWGWWL